MKPLHTMSADEAASHVLNGQTVAFSGFTPAGAAKVVPKAIAERAKKLHAQGEPFRIGVMSGASTSRSLDGSLAQAEAVLFRTPYQADPDLRKSINEGRTAFFDLHLSMMPQAVRYGFLGAVHWAVVEACDVNESGEITLTSSVGAAPTFCHKADKIIIELNRFHPTALRGFHDIYEPEDPPYRNPLPIFRPADRIGSPTVKVNPDKIFAVVSNDAPDEAGTFGELAPTTRKIGENVAEFLSHEMARGLIPKSFLPVQSGVGDTANAVLQAMGQHPGIPQFDMYTEVIQDAVIGLIKQGKVRFASGCSLTVTNPLLAGDLREHPRVPIQTPAPPTGDHQQPRDCPPAWYPVCQHGHRGGHCGQRQQHPHHGPQHHERHRRVRGLRPQRFPLHLHLPLDGQGRQD